MTTATTAAMAIAEERQLDWLLGEVLGGEAARVCRPARRRTMPWLATAIAVLAAGAATAVAVLQRGVAAGGDRGGNEAPIQEPGEPAWHECHGPAAIADVPADVTALRCFDFDDAACVRLATFTKLEHLDLSGMDVDARGVSRAPQITDAGVRSLASLTALRSLSLASCHDMKGEGLAVLEAMPRLEHLDLTYSGVESPAIERLPRLPSLRTLVLSHCMNFHGRSLEAVANIPRLRRLELRACTTLSAKDVLHVAKLKELRHLDLRDCQGRFRGQRAWGPDGGATFVDTDNDGLPDQRVEPPPPPVEDGIGITDAVVEALAELRLETLLLGGSESLTDAIGPALAKMTTLRSLDLVHLQKTTGSLLMRVPVGLEELAIDHNPQFTVSDLRRLPELPRLREFGLGGVRGLDDETLQFLLTGKQLTHLRLDAMTRTSQNDRGAPALPKPRLTAAVGELLSTQTELRSVTLRGNASWADATVMASLARLPKLQELDLSPNGLRVEHLRALAASRSLQVLQLRECRVDLDGLRELGSVPLRELNLFGTQLDPSAVRALGQKHWPGCTITLPNGSRFRAP